MKATCIRTKMIGGGTSYDVYLPIREKGYRPIAAGCYATIIHDGPDWKRDQFYRVDDFLRTPHIDNLPILTTERIEAFDALGKVAKRLEISIARRAFPELDGLRELPFLWTNENHDSALIEIEIDISRHPEITD